MLVNHKRSHRVLRDVHCQKTYQGSLPTLNLWLMLVKFAHKGKIQGKIGVGMLHTQHGIQSDGS